MSQVKNILTNTLEHLPEAKKQALARIKEIILQHIEPEMVILFGSHATDKWVEDEYVEDGITYSYTSDYDILVVTKNRRSSYGDWPWRNVVQDIKRDKEIGPTTIIHHSINFLNEKIRDQYYFFTDIYYQGVILYNSQRYELDSPQELSAEKRKQKAEEYFEYWSEQGEDALEGFDLFLSREKYKKAAFELHQATECYYSAFLLVFIDHRPKTHDLEELGDRVSQIKAELKDVFPRTTEEEARKFELLKRAYIESRYKKDYKITAEELNDLAPYVLLLREMVAKFCQAEIERLTKAMEQA